MSHRLRGAGAGYEREKKYNAEANHPPKGKKFLGREHILNGNLQDLDEEINFSGIGIMFSGFPIIVGALGNSYSGGNL
jgi:hypothetical protein